MRLTTAGEYGGQALTAIVEDVPAGLRVSAREIERDLQRCQRGYGFDPEPFQYAEITSGVRDGHTTGAPLSLLVYGEARSEESLPATLQVRQAVPRPGRGDLPALLSTAADDFREVALRLESFDEAACVAASFLPREYLAELGVEVYSYVSGIGTVRMEDLPDHTDAANPLDVEFSPVRCPHEETSQAMEQEVERAAAEGRTLGGVFNLVVMGLVPGAGVFTERHNGLTGALAQALFSLPGVTGVEFGRGFKGARLDAEEVHDALEAPQEHGFSYLSNNDGGLEAGLTTGMPLVIRVAVAASSDLPLSLGSVDIDTLQPAQASAYHNLTCAVPGIAVAAEAEISFVLANAYARMFGSNAMADVKAAYRNYLERLRTVAR